MLGNEIKVLDRLRRIVRDLQRLGRCSAQQVHQAPAACKDGFQNGNVVHHEPFRYRQPDKDPQDVLETELIRQRHRFAAEPDDEEQHDKRAAYGDEVRFHRFDICPGAAALKGFRRLPEQ
jgi:hypothetical protein